jgi:hypothetical protein
MKRQAKAEPRPEPRPEEAKFPALFGFAYDPAASAAFGSLSAFDFRVESLGDAYFM